MAVICSVTLMCQSHTILQRVFLRVPYRQERHILLAIPLSHLLLELTLCISFFVLTLNYSSLITNHEKDPDEAVLLHDNPMLYCIFCAFKSSVWPTDKVPEILGVVFVKFPVISDIVPWSMPYDKLPLTGLLA